MDDNYILEAVEAINRSSLDAEISVLESLIAAYDKSIALIQEADDDADLTEFDIFQEGAKWEKFKEDTKAPVLGNKGESLAKRLLMILPRLIQKIAALITKLIKGNKNIKRQMNNDVKALKAAGNVLVSDDDAEQNETESENPAEPEHKDVSRSSVKNELEAAEHASKEKLNKKYFTIYNTKFFSFDATDDDKFLFQQTGKHVVFSFGIDWKILKRDVFENVPTDASDLKQMTEFTECIENTLIPVITDSLKRLRLPYNFSSTVKVKYSDIVDTIENMKQLMAEIFDEIDKCINNIDKIQPGIKAELEKITNSAIDGDEFYYKWDEALNKYHGFEKTLWQAVEYLVEYRDVIKSIWDRHIKLVEDAVQKKYHHVTFRFTDTAFISKFLDK